MHIDPILQVQIYRYKTNKLIRRLFFALLIMFVLLLVLILQFVCAKKIAFSKHLCRFPCHGQMHMEL